MAGRKGARNRRRYRSLPAVDEVMLETRSTMQLALLYMLRRGTEVSIPRLYARIGTGRFSHREKQMRLGGVISRLNKKLVHRGYRIVPGVMRGTYRMITLDS